MQCENASQGFVPLAGVKLNSSRISFDIYTDNQSELDIICESTELIDTQFFGKYTKASSNIRLINFMLLLRIYYYYVGISFKISFLDGISKFFNDGIKFLDCFQTLLILLIIQETCLYSRFVANMTFLFADVEFDKRPNVFCSVLFPLPKGDSNRCVDHVQFFGVYIVTL